MEVEDWQEARSSPPSNEDEEDEVVTFNIGGHHIPASLVAKPGLPDKENETGMMRGTPDKLGAASGAMYEAMGLPTGSALPRTPQQDPFCRSEAACRVPPTPPLPAAIAEMSRTPLGPSKSAAMQNHVLSPSQAGMASPVPSAAVAVDDRTPGAFRRLSSASPTTGSAAKSPRPVAAAALPPQSTPQQAPSSLPMGHTATLSSPRSDEAMAQTPQGPAALATPTALQDPAVSVSHQVSVKGSGGGVKGIVHAIEARTTQLLQFQQQVRRSSKEYLPGSIEAEAEQVVEKEEDETDAAARRLSAGLSMRYESSGEHCPKYSQRELDIIVNKRLEDLRTTYEAKLRVMGEQLMDAQTRADAASQSHMQYQMEINQQLETTWADYERRAQEAEGKLAAKDWQLNAVTQQAQDLCSKVTQLETELADARKKLEDAAGVEDRLSKEYTQKLEAEKNRRRKDVQDMKELVSSRAKEQFAKAQEQYKQLGCAYSETKEELNKLSTQYNMKEQELASAQAAKEQALSSVSGLEQEMASLRSSLSAKDIDIARISKEMETRAEESRLLLEKEIFARDNAIRDREQALDSLSRTAISLQDLKRRFEELQVVHETTLGELHDHKAMCEELLCMLEKKEGQQAAVEQKE